MTEHGEFEHESLPEAGELFAGYRILLARHGAYQEGDGVHTVAESFVLDGALLPLEVQTLVDKIEFVPYFDDHGEAGGDYLLVVLPPNPRGLMRSIQIFTLGDDVHMEAWDSYESDDDAERIEEELILLKLSDVERLKRLISQDKSPTASEIRRLGRVLAALNRHFGEC